MILYVLYASAEVTVIRLLVSLGRVTAQNTQGIAFIQRA